ncbi:hypothetical protein U1Q18_009213 [Sarracenia purpurea var. burkii]
MFRGMVGSYGVVSSWLIAVGCCGVLCGVWMACYWHKKLLKAELVLWTANVGAYGCGVGVVGPCCCGVGVGGLGVEGGCGVVGASRVDPGTHIWVGIGYNRWVGCWGWLQQGHLLAAFVVGC